MNEPSILDYLSVKGIELRKEGNKYFCSSPFSADSNWSFCVYPHTNSFFDWSNGFGGGIWLLMSRLENKTIYELKKQHNEYEAFKPYTKQHNEKQVSKTAFDYTRYINTNAEECKKIKEYAETRCLEEGSYFCGVFFTRSGTSGLQEIGHSWIRNPAVAFLHVDKDLKPCGIKFRKLTDQNPRFSARGSLGYYIPHTNFKDKAREYSSPVLYVVEGEVNANSLEKLLRDLNKKAEVISLGAVSMCPSKLPKIYENLPVKVIIDYDGNEELYQERLKLYSHLNVEPIKLILPKGEDINSLHMKNKLYLIENLL